MDSQDIGSAYTALQANLRTDTGALKHYASIDSNFKQDTYNLVKQVAAGQIQLSKDQTEQLAIDAYNCLGDKKSATYLTIANIKQDLGFKKDLRKRTLDLGGMGRREQITERKNSLLNKVAENYTVHLANSDGTLASFNAWEDTMLGLGVSYGDLQSIVTEAPIPVSLYLS